LGDAEASDFFFDEFEWVRRGGEGFLTAIAVHFLGTVFPRGDREGWSSATEAVATDVFTAGDGLKQEAGPLAAKAGIDRDGGFEVGHQVEADGHDITGAGELAEGGLVRD
jgi:hypothetical protein